MILGVVIPIAVILTLIVVNGVFVAAEFALVGSRPSRLQKAAAAGNPAAKWLLGIFGRKNGKDSYVAVAQLGITLASIGLGMYGEPSVAKWLYGPLEAVGVPSSVSHTIGFIVALSIITYLHVVIGEMIPKALALQNPEQVALRINPVMRLATNFFKPAVSALNWLAFALMKLLGIKEPDSSSALHTDAELAIVTEESAADGQLGAMQKNMIKNLLGLKSRPVAEIMTPRSRVVYLSSDLSVSEVASKIAETNHTRYPVIGKDLDDVLGVLHIKDFIRAKEKVKGSWAAAVRPLYCAAATSPTETLLTIFKAEQIHASLIVDEFGGTLGFVTMDDIISEVMDKEVDQGQKVVINTDGSVSLEGETTVNELREDYGIKIENPHVITVAGLVLHACGSVPEVGTKVLVDDYCITVTEVEKRKIIKVLIAPNAEEA